MTYKNFGIPSTRTTEVNGSAGEYNTGSIYYQPRINDLYMHLPPFGNGTSNFVSWTPAYKRVPPDISEGFPTKVTTLVLTLEEATNNPKTVAQLSSAGLTLYYKLVDQSSTLDDVSTTRETIVAAGKFTQGGTIGTPANSPRPGSTFGFPVNYGFCMGFKMGDSAPDTSYNGLYHYYIVNNNSGNEKEIVWRMKLAIGFTYRIVTGLSAGTGMTLGGNDIVIENASEPSNNISFGDELLLIANPPYYTINRRINISEIPFSGKTADNYFINYVNAPNSIILQGGIGTDINNLTNTSLDDVRPYKIDPTPLT
jgi:hypothetical protein